MIIWYQCQSCNLEFSFMVDSNRKCNQCVYCGSADIIQFKKTWVHPPGSWKHKVVTKKLLK